MAMLFSLFGLGGGAAAGGAAATAGAAASGLSMSSVLGGLATVGTVLTSLASANAQADAYRTQAWNTEMEKGQEEIQAMQRGTQFKRELARVLGENDVAYAGAGIDISGGEAAGGRATAQQRAAEEVSIERANTNTRLATYDARAGALRSMAARTQSLGAVSAFTTGFNSFLRLV